MTAEDCTRLAARRSRGYPRPKAATLVRASLVPAYIQCASPNRTHGPPLRVFLVQPAAAALGRAHAGSPTQRRGGPDDGVVEARGPGREPGHVRRRGRCRGSDLDHGRALPHHQCRLPGGSRAPTTRVACWASRPRCRSRTASTLRPARWAGPEPEEGKSSSRFNASPRRTRASARRAPSRPRSTRCCPARSGRASVRSGSSARSTCAMRGPNGTGFGIARLPADVRGRG